MYRLYLTISNWKSEPKDRIHLITNLYYLLQFNYGGYMQLINSQQILSYQKQTRSHTNYNAIKSYYIKTNGAEVDENAQLI